jgi:hypothetical protein
VTLFSEDGLLLFIAVVSFQHHAGVTEQQQKLVAMIEAKSSHQSTAIAPLLSQDCFSLWSQFLFLWPRPSSLVSHHLESINEFFVMMLLLQIFISGGGEEVRERERDRQSFSNYPSLATLR